MATQTCQHCGATFEAIPSARRVYCSLGCANRAAGLDRKSSGKARDERVAFPCSECGVVLFDLACNRTGARVFCSNACYQRARGKDADRRLSQRFWSKVDRSGDCWVWTGGTDQHGYGQFVAQNRRLRAHRVAYELTHGAIPDDTSVCHRCDNPPCVRPDHLFLGSHQDNMDDMNRKGRHGRSPARGETAGNAKLTDAAVREMRALWAAGGLTKRAIAKRFGISDSNISRILNGQSWTHVE